MRLPWQGTVVSNLVCLPGFFILDLCIVHCYFCRTFAARYLRIQELAILYEKNNKGIIYNFSIRQDLFTANKTHFRRQAVPF